MWAAIQGRRSSRRSKKNHVWIKDVNVVKIKDYTHVMKLEFQTVEEADRVLKN